MDLKNIATLVTLVIIVGGVIWNASSQNSKIEQNAKEIQDLKVQVANTVKLSAGIEYLITSVNDLKKKEEERVERDRQFQLQQIKERDELITTLRSLRR
jgi:hypothetical protein